MNVLIIFFKNNALNTYTGNSSRVFNFIKFLIDYNCNVSILHSMEAKEFENEILRKRCKVYYHRNYSKSFLRECFFFDINPFLLISLYKILRKQKFDIIQLEYPYGFFLLKLFVKKKSPIILDSHNIESESLKIHSYKRQIFRILYPFVKLIMKRYQSFVYKLTNAVICISDEDRQHLIKNYKINREKINVIHTPSTINHEKKWERTLELKKKFREKLGLPLNKTIIIFHGVYDHFPNQEGFTLIKNFISRKINNPDIIFVIAGQNLKKFKENNIISIGFVKNLNELMFAADFAIIPIISGEGYKTKCADYIITGLPFISTKKGIQGINFLINGVDYLLYNTVDSDFIDGIKILYENKELRESMSKNLYQKTSFISQKKIGKQLIKLYLKLNNLIKL